jgi:glucoamylase
MAVGFGTRAVLAAALTVALIGVTPGGAMAVPAGGAAPGAPGVDEQYLPADKVGLGTSTTTGSTVWFTVQKSGGLGEIFYPAIDSPSARALTFVVADSHGHADRAGEVADVRTTLADERSLSFRQEFTERHGRWRLTAEYVSDPDRSTVLVDLRFTARGAYDVYALFDPALGNSRGGDAGRTDGAALVATDATTGVSSAFVGSPAFTATSSGFAGTSDGWTDLKADGRLDGRYTSAAAGSLVQTAQTGLTGRPGHERATLALGFGPDAGAALASARATLRPRFDAVAGAYARGWRQYLDRLRPPPSSVDGSRQLYRVSAMVLAAAEDKTHRGAYVAAPAAPWAFGRDDPSGPYHLVWSRDLYQIATGLIASGDTAGANRALDFLFTVQQKPDGSFPQNSRVDGTPVWGGLQLDEVALPIVLAYQLGRTDAGTWAGAKRAADFLLSFTQDGFAAPWTPAERWENQSGYSPNTIATEIAGLVCAAYLARANGDEASSARYLATADDWQSKVKGWTVTTTGPYSSGPYFLRLTKDGNPNAGTTYNIGDSGPSNVDQRTVVDPSFLDLVRLGVLPANDPAVVNTLRVVDAQLGYATRNGFFWHRASFDGYGEKANGDPWDFGLPDDSLITRGRGWPLLGGERGEYLLAAGDVRGARTQLATLARAAGPGLMLPEQVWDLQAPPGVAPGTPTTSATPLTWAHAQFLRLARDVAAGRVLEQPDIVAARYASAG